MATAKTPKKTPAAAPATVKPMPVARAAGAKPAPVRAAEAKTPEDAIVHSAEIVSKPVAQVAEPVVQVAEKAAVETAKVTEKAATVATKAADAVVTRAAEKTTAEVTKAAEKTTAEMTKAADTVTEIASRPTKAVAIVSEAAAETRGDVLKSVTPFLDFSRDNAILLVAAGNELALGLHKLSLSLIDWSAESCDKSVAAGQAMLSATSVEEVIDLSQSLAKDSLEQLLKEGSELSALSSKLIEDTIVPLSGRLAAAVGKLAAYTA